MHKLHEHIRLGAAMYDKCTGSYVENLGNDDCEACAIGAALLSVGANVSEIKEDWPCTSYRTKWHNLLIKHFPVAAEIASYPKNGPPIMLPGDLVLHLNNQLTIAQIIDNLNYHWDREAIADWLEPIEESWIAKNKKMQPEEQKVTV